MGNNIGLVIADVDGTLVTHDKVLTRRERVDRRKSILQSKGVTLFAVHWFGETGDVHSSSGPILKADHLGLVGKRDSDIDILLIRVGPLEFLRILTSQHNLAFVAADHDGTIWLGDYLRPS